MFVKSLRPEKIAYLYFMDIQVEKLNFIEWLNKQSDSNLFTELKELQQRYLSSSKESKTTDLEKLLDKSIRQYETGNVIDHALVMEEMEKKYGKL